MAHDVFISHAHKDKNFANALCEKLESSQVKCWIAGRDISAGDDWTEAIRNAIGSSRLIVLVLSESANAAIHIEREIAHAYYAKRTILPVMLTETPPPACAVMLNGIWPREPKSSVTVCLRPCKSEPCPGL